MPGKGDSLAPLFGEPSDFHEVCGQLAVLRRMVPGLAQEAAALI